MSGIKFLPATSTTAVDDQGGGSDSATPRAEKSVKGKGGLVGGQLRENGRVQGTGRH